MNVFISYKTKLYNFFEMPRYFCYNLGSSSHLVRIMFWLLKKERLVFIKFFWKKEENHDKSISFITVLF